MKIKLNILLIKFDSILVGECFLYDGNLFIKVSSNKKDLNAFNCTENILTGFSKVTYVQPVNMILQEV